MWQSWDGYQYCFSDMPTFQFTLALGSIADHIEALRGFETKKYHGRLTSSLLKLANCKS